jgi:hypothetical protein
MFVLLFGLMGVAAIFPVASHYIVEGEKRDRGSGLAQVAFEEIKSRKLLRPMEWIYPDHQQDYLFNNWLMHNSKDPVNSVPLKNGQFWLAPDATQTPGHAFVIDPLGGAEVTSQYGREFFPSAGDNVDRPWPNLLFPLVDGTYITPGPSSPWPVRRMTLSMPNPNPDMNGMVPYVAMDRRTAEMAFRLRDDLVTDQPEAGDRPSIQKWATADPNSTPNDFSDDTMLSRQYTGNYTWMATVVPTRQRALSGLQSAANIEDEFYEVTAVVFYKRDTVPSASIAGSPGSERLMDAEFLNSGELVIYDTNTGDEETVDTALDKIKPANWIAVMGVHPVTGMFLMKWYKIMAMDEATEEDIPLNNGSLVDGRYLMVQGPDWPEVRTNVGPTGWVNLRVAILPGAIDAYTRVMQIEQN